MRDLFDTRPVKPIATDTQRIKPLRRGISPVLLFMAVATVALLIGIGLYLLQPVLRQMQPPPAVSVTLILDGLPRTVRTTALTVGALLREQDVVMDAQMAVDPPIEATLSAGARVLVDEARAVSVTVDGATSVFRTVIENPAELLRAAGVVVSADDLITVNGAPLSADLLASYPLPANRISVQHAVRFRVTDEGQSTQEFVTTLRTIGEALQEAGIVLYLADRVMPPIETEMRAGLDIQIDRALLVQVSADGAVLETRTQALDVSGVLIELGVALNGLDYAVPPENARLRPDMQIRVVRVTEAYEVTRSDVPFDTLYQASAELELDLEALGQAGQVGVDERRTVIRYEDGVEISRRDEGTVRVQEPVNQIMLYGTRVVLRSIDTPDGPREYYRKLRMYATSYHPAALGGDDVTATGARLRKGIVAINPRVVPYGSTLYVEGYGVGTAADTGGPRSTPYWIDLGYSDDDYRSWSRWVDVYLLAPVPGNLPVTLP